MYLDNAKQQIELAKDIHEVKTIRDKAITLQDLARRQKLGLHIQNDVAEIRLYAERRAGEILKETVEHGGDRKSKSRSTESTLKNIGISKNQSSNWQHIADIPEEDFIQHIERTKDKDKELTTTDVLRLAKKYDRKEENYLRVINEIMANYPKKRHLKIIRDFCDWTNDIRTMPVTAELKEIITKLTKEKK